MFKVYGIIGISKIEFFNFSGAESVKGLSVAKNSLRSESAPLSI